MQHVVFVPSNGNFLQNFILKWVFFNGSSLNGILVQYWYKMDDNMKCCELFLLLIKVVNSCLKLKQTVKRLNKQTFFLSMFLLLIQQKIIRIHLLSLIIQKSRLHYFLFKNIIQKCNIRVYVAYLATPIVLLHFFAHLRNKLVDSAESKELL